MTANSGAAGRGARADEVNEYVAEVRAALADLAPAEQEALLEDLPGHLVEVAAEDPTPLRTRLGPPEAYAAELRTAAAEGAVDDGGDPRQRLREGLRRLRERSSRLDARVGPLLGYPRVSEFGRLLVPAWWLLRGYLAAMIVVNLLDQRGELGLLPRLGGSTLAGWVILAVFVAGSVWLGRRTPQLREWPRRTVFVGSAFVALIGLVHVAGLDSDRRHQAPPVHHAGGGNHDPLREVVDVYALDSEGRLLTEVTLLDQHGNPINLGWDHCRSVTDPTTGARTDSEPRVTYRPDGSAIFTYPLCPAQLPWWLDPQGAPAAVPTPTPTPTSGPAPSSNPSVEPSASPTSTPSPDSSASPDLESAPAATVSPTPTPSAAPTATAGG
ncbi:hypothetical protein JQS43_22595 [Natronosporangium hydrolyticum]|uniref:Uncharacterized protein n=1 Tax=Natronosporangium hydrolyticum TaxID=2811111 RepID=A0A895Y954_9ACTN|nr:hypothetical protein [Natronosporangium hydrolyticum]QSB14267.1 hypothetical protein JQS43_22595 [Natronosporangium hydrolyticum]